MLAMSFTTDIESGGGTGVLTPDSPLEKRRGGAGNFPPINWDDFGGGGGGGGDDDEDGYGEEFDGEFGGRPANRTFAAAEFGLGLGLVAIGTLFLSFLGAYYFLGRAAEGGEAARLPGAEAGLWLSTAVLLVSSVCMSTAVRAGREGAEATLISWLCAAFLGGVLFLCVQIQVWHTLHGAGLLPATNGYGAIFYTLTGLHGAHMLAGVTYLGTLIVRLRRGNEKHLARGTVKLCGVYWHFMGAVWLVLFCVL